jgi:hypothetical protein
MPINHEACPCCGDLIVDCICDEWMERMDDLEWFAQ